MKKPLLVTATLLATVSISFTTYNVGLNNGTEAGKSIGFEKGYSQGMIEGREKGYKEGYFTGLNKGTETGFDRGYNLGIIEGKQEAKVKTVIPDGYIKLTECIPLQDISCTWTNEYDYLCVEIGDYGKQLDNPSNATYESVLSDIPNVTEEYRNNMVNMSEVVNYDATESGLYLYMEDGSEYYFEK